MNDSDVTNLSAESTDKLEEMKAPEMNPESKVEEVAANEAPAEEKTDAEPETVSAPVETEAKEIVEENSAASEPVVETPEEAEEVASPEPAPEEPVEQPQKTAEPSPSEAEEAPETKDIPIATASPDAVIVNEEITAKEPKGKSVPLADFSKLTKDEIIAKLAVIVEMPIEEINHNEVDALKQAFYRIRHGELENEKKVFLDDGGREEDWEAPKDEIEEKLKELLAAYKEKRAELTAEQDKVKAANYALKLQLIDQLKELITSQDDFNKVYNQFKDLQARWKEIKLVPQEHANELWKEYQHYTEQFYDIIKINNQFRDYDFKKNLEQKTLLCEAVEKLTDESDIVAAHRQLQKLYAQWHDIGPVAKEIREEIWNRFKTAATVINKRHADFYESLKKEEQANLAIKEEICQKLESIDVTVIKTMKEWEDKAQEVSELLSKWKSVGFVPYKSNQKLYDRLHTACNNFFEKRNEYRKEVKNAWKENLQKKTALCEQAEALKDSTNWKEAASTIAQLREQWKLIGPVARKHKDVIWKRFSDACEYFFKQKETQHNSAEAQNLTAKQQLIEEIKALESESFEEVKTRVNEIRDKWKAIGFVPYKLKDKLYEDFKTAIDEQFDRIRGMRTDRKSGSDSKSSEKSSQGKLYGEREKLMRSYETMKSDLTNRENNIGFLKASSKSANSFIKEAENQIIKLKEKMAELEKKINEIDENLE